MHWELGIGCVVSMQDTTQVQSGAWQNLLNRYIKTNPKAEWFNQLHLIGHLRLRGYLHVTSWFITIFAVYIEKTWGEPPIHRHTQITNCWLICVTPISVYTSLYIHITFYPIVYSIYFHMVVFPQIGVPQIIQIMDDQWYWNPWWLGIPL